MVEFQEFVTVLTPTAISAGQITCWDDECQHSMTPATLLNTENTQSVFHMRHLNQIRGISNCKHDIVAHTAMGDVPSCIMMMP
jgi:hypothetical protein